MAARNQQPEDTGEFEPAPASENSANVGETSVEIDVEELIAQIESEAPVKGSPEEKLARQRLEELQEIRRIQRELSDFDEFDLDDL